MLVDLAHRIKLIELEMKKIEGALLSAAPGSFEDYLKLVYKHQGLKQALQLVTQRDAAEDGE